MVLAEDYGYQLSPQPAQAMTPKIREEVQKAIADTAVKGANSSKAARGMVFTLVAVLSVSLAITTQFFWLLLIGFLVAWVLSDSAGKSSAKTAKAAEERVRELTTPVLDGRWQAWPCRMEAVANTPQRRVLLLDPSGEAAVTFLSDVPGEAWLGLTDGRGLVWFVGDLRFGGMMALPGGDPLWWTGPPVPDPAPAPAPSPSGGRKALEEELARQAVKFAFDAWLR
ncbi:hypothetical protein FPZ12_023425 [Amycolatopsis acidicola]|uniref:Uncharacterized protein n=1 Tax=Amycolatopsis acidicola TaxID=2596893 RepID=A0A5N0V128_9PSEU|nr:hypothetical protein [Amycolatopsis acidicola]KAA9158060.1 hypothetical protein FPZ12_023425 [Amycolatopsis acidicola]